MIKENIPVSDKGAAQVAQGRLWIFSNEIQLKKPYPEPGSWVRFSNRDKIIGTGYYNPHSLIAGRVLSFFAETDVSQLLQNRLRAALERRAEIIKNGSCRLVFSESDFIPGLIVDYFSGVAVIQSTTAGIDHALPIIENLFPALFKKVFGGDLIGLVIRGDSGFRKLEGLNSFNRIALGKESDLRESQFHNQGVHYAANFVEGQKTGFFLDQANNRDFLAKLIAQKPGQEILDLFCYSGGWGLRALKEGKCRVVFVDESEDAIQLAQKGISLNKFSPQSLQTVRANAFDYLQTPSSAFDIIVSDPPAFAKTKKDIPAALKGYEKLNRLAWGKLKNDGVLIASSCSHHISDGDFLDCLQRAVGKAGGMAQIIFVGSQAPDHPVLLSMPETKYLKCFGLRKLN